MSFDQDPIDDPLIDALLIEQGRRDRETAIRSIESAIMADLVSQSAKRPGVDWKLLLVSGSVAAAVVLGFGYTLSRFLQPHVPGPAREAPMTYVFRYEMATPGTEPAHPQRSVQQRSLAPAHRPPPASLSKGFPEVAISPPVMAVEWGRPDGHPEVRKSAANRQRPWGQFTPDQRPYPVGTSIDQIWCNPVAQPLSGFAIDVASEPYADLAQSIRDGREVSRDSVFIEECINAFAYDHAAPANGEAFALDSELVSCPWNDRHLLVKVAIAGREAEAGSEPETIATDARIEIEFNPRRVESYRLLGYSDVVVGDHALDDRKVDADIKAGHSVVAFYEIIPAGTVMATPRPGKDLKYQPSLHSRYATGPKDEWLTLKLSYLEPDSPKRCLQEAVLKGHETLWHLADADTRFASTVALFGMKLRGQEDVSTITWEHVLAMAGYGLSEELPADRAEFIKLVKLLRDRQR